MGGEGTNAAQQTENSNVQLEMAVMLQHCNEALHTGTQCTMNPQSVRSSCRVVLLR